MGSGGRGLHPRAWPAPALGGLWHWVVALRLTKAPLPAARIATSLEGFDVASVQQQRQEQSYFVRLGSLSERLRQRAYEHSLGKLRSTRQRAQDGLQQLAQALSLVSALDGAAGGAGCVGLALPQACRAIFSVLSRRPSVHLPQSPLRRFCCDQAARCLSP